VKNLDIGSKQKFEADVDLFTDEARHHFSSKDAAARASKNIWRKRFLA